MCILSETFWRDDTEDPINSRGESLQNVCKLSRDMRASVIIIIIHGTILREMLYVQDCEFILAATTAARLK